MKTIKIITIATMFMFATTSMNSQVSINVNIGSQPVWAPVNAVSTDYYYIPDIQCYYDVHATQFIYLNAGVWKRSRNLPAYCRNYDLNRGYKVVLNDYHGSRPYANYNYHKVKYYKGYRGKSQQKSGHNHRKDYNNTDYVSYNDRGRDYDNHGKSKKHDNHDNGHKR